MRTRMHWRGGVAALTLLGLAGTLLTVLAASPAAAAPGPYVAITPARVLDTRTAPAPLGPGEARPVTVAGANGVPANATAVVLNVTATNPTSDTYLTVWPSGPARPGTSNLNVAAGTSRANLVTVAVGTNGSVTVANAFGTTDVLVDVMGYFTSGFTGVGPARLVDTRQGLGGGSYATGETRSVAVTGVAGVPVGAAAVALNVTVTGAGTDGYVTVWPTGGDVPATSNVSMAPGATIATLVLTGVGPDGTVQVRTSNGPVDVIVDVMGWIPSGGGFTGIAPVRVADTRAATCGVTLRPGETRTIAVAGAHGTAGLPTAGVGAVALGITATNATADGYLTVWPTGTTRPGTSILNTTVGHSVSNLVAVGVGADGQVDVANGPGSVDVVIDVLGWFDGDTPAGAPVPCPPHQETVGDGTHLVGVDMSPGRYVTTTATAGCHWQRRSGTYGFASEVLADGGTQGRVIVDVRPNDVAFVSQLCGTWTTVDPAATPSPSATIADGDHLVGVELVPGRYLTVSGTTNCYWERRGDFSGDAAARLANNLGSGTRIVDIAPGDVGFLSRSCGTWTLLSPATTPAATTSVGDGAHLVPAEMGIGRWRATGTTTCAWQRRAGFTFAPGSSEQLGQGGGTGTLFVDLVAGDVGFVTSGCGTWTKVA